MAKTLEDATKKIQEHARSMAGVRNAPDYPPGSAPPGIFAVAKVNAATTYLVTDGLRRTMATILCAILTPFKDLARDTEKMLPFYEAFVDLIEGDPTLGGTVDVVNTEQGIRGNLDVYPYNSIPHYGWRIEIDVKINS